MIGLTCICHYRAIIPIVGNIITISISKDICTCISRIGRTKIACVTYTVKIGISLKRVRIGNTIIGGIRIAIAIGISCTSIASICWTRIARISKTICICIYAINAGWTCITIVTHAIAISISLQRISFEGTIIRTIRNSTGSVSKATISYPIIVSISTGIANITQTISIVVGLRSIGNGRTVIPVIGNTIVIGINSIVNTIIRRIIRTKIAGISNAIRISIDSIGASGTSIAIIAHTITVGIGLRWVGLKNTIIRAI